jgi:hypothetical protein
MSCNVDEVRFLERNYWALPFLVVSRVGIQVASHAATVADTGARSGWESDAGLCYTGCVIVRLVVLRGCVFGLRWGKERRKRRSLKDRNCPAKVNIKITIIESRIL